MELTKQICPYSIVHCRADGSKLDGGNQLNQPNLLLLENMARENIEVRGLLCGGKIEEIMKQIASSQNTTPSESKI